LTTLTPNWQKFPSLNLGLDTKYFSIKFGKLKF